MNMGLICPKKISGNGLINAMSLRLYFLRHGETVYSQRGAYCGTTDPDLTPEGQQMAQAFADAYGKAYRWQAVYVSPMQRAWQTVQPFCQATGLAMRIADGLSEIDYGAWENREQEDVKNHHQQDYVHWMTEPAWNPPTHGETAIEVASRAMPVIAEIKAEINDGNMLVVSHKATIRIILCSLLGIDMGRYRDRIDAPAASISVIRFGDHGPML
jgi:broad specificity phosphatase PhoE